MIAATGAKNGARVAPAPTSRPPTAAATATPACTIVAPARPHALPARAHRDARALGGVLEQALRDHSVATVLDQVQPEQRLGERARRRAPSPRARRTRARARRRAACRAGSSRSPGAPPPRAPSRCRRAASPVPHHGGRTNSIHRCARPAIRTCGRSRSAAWVMPTCPAGSPSASSAIAHQVVVCAQPLADRADLEAVRRRLPALRRPLAVGLEAEPGGARERRRVIRDRDPDVQRGGVHVAQRSDGARSQAQVEG